MNEQKKKKREYSSEPIMKIEKGEKFYKIFVFRPSLSWPRDRKSQYRIFVKEKTDGNLEMACYSYKELPDGTKIKGDVLKIPDVPKEKINEIIEGMHRAAGTFDDEYEEVDMTKFDTIDEQLEFMRQSNLFGTYEER